MKLLKTIIFGFALFLLCFSAIRVYAIEDPLSKPNNYYGVHILFPEELERAKKLINSNGGDWGYVTIPIQIQDRDIDKWQKFMNEAGRLHVIPLVRLATEPDYSNTSVWRIPTEEDILDFANFLNSLSWPTKNRYVILFNEINRSDEWGGKAPDPARYAQLVSYSYEVFKQRNSDFYLILGGLDSAAPQKYPEYMSAEVYLQQMVQEDPSIFNKIDGFSSHSYPNPNFAAAPAINRRVSVGTYKYEYDFINQYTTTKKPAFITETGWNGEALSEETISEYFKTTFETIWSQDRDKIVAVTPFLLESQNGIFDKFSFMKNGEPKKAFKTLEALLKVEGKPQVIEQSVKAAATVVAHTLGVRDFRNVQHQPVEQVDTIPPLIRLYFKSILGLNT